MVATFLAMLIAQSSAGLPLPIEAGQEIALPLTKNKDQVWVLIPVDRAGWITLETRAPLRIQFFNTEKKDLGKNPTVRLRSATTVLGRVTLHRDLEKPATATFSFYPDEDWTEPNDTVETAAKVPLDRYVRIATGGRTDAALFETDAPDAGILYFEAANVPNGLTPICQPVQKNGQLGHAFDPKKGLFVEKGRNILRVRDSQGRDAPDPFEIRFRWTRSNDDFSVVRGELKKMDLFGVYVLEHRAKHEPHGFEVKIEKPGFVFLANPYHFYLDRAHWYSPINLTGLRIQKDGGEWQDVEKLGYSMHSHAAHLKKGTYRFKFWYAWNFDGPSRTPIQIRFIESKHGYDPLGAKSLGLNEEHQIQRTPHMPEWYRIDIPRPGTLQVIASKTEGRGTVAPARRIELYAEDGKTLIKSMIQVKGPQYAFDTVVYPDRTLHLKKGGAYLLKLPTDDAYPHPYTLEANFVPDDAKLVAKTAGGMTTAYVGLGLGDLDRMEARVVAGVSGSLLADGKVGETFHEAIKEAVEAAEVATAPPPPAPKPEPKPDAPPAQSLAAKFGVGLLLIGLVAGVFYLRKRNPT